MMKSSVCTFSLFTSLLVASVLPGHAVSCRKVHAAYASDAIPKFTGSTGPFGTVCEVAKPEEFPSPPSVPADLQGKAFVVRSRFPNDFMTASSIPLVDFSERKTLNSAPNMPSDVKSSSMSTPVSCAEDMYVDAVGVMMDERVHGIKGGSSLWAGGCARCGEELEKQGLLQSGWFCQIAHIAGSNSANRSLAIGIWLKRLGDTSSHSVDSITLATTPVGPEIIGFGGAFTDAAAVANDMLSTDLQQALVDGYFGPNGAGFTVGRVPFGGADFSRRPYSLLDDYPGDLNLTNMCLMDDREHAECGQDAKVDMIKAALAQSAAALQLYAQNGTVAAREPALKLFFSPWSAPAWMKTSNKLAGGYLRGIGPGDWSDGDRVAGRAWADSYVKFADLYAQQGIHFWGLTLQNEPGADQFVSWNSASVSGAAELDLVGLVGPRMRAAHPNIKIMVHDDQVYSLKDRLVKSGAGILASKYVDGVAYHWYGSVAGTLENVTAEHAVDPLPIGPAAFGGGIEVRQVYQEHIKGSGKFLLGTEACNGYLVDILHSLKDAESESNNRGVRPGDWHRGYRYSRDIFYQLDNGASGWTGWNLLLMPDGGPNWAGNNVDAPMIVSPEGNLWVNPMYFHLAHFSKYVVPGSMSIPVDRSNTELKEIVAFLRPDDRIVIVALCDTLDGHGDPPANRLLQVRIGNKVFELEILSSSIVTAVFDAPSDDHVDIQV